MFVHSLNLNLGENKTFVHHFWGKLWVERLSFQASISLNVWKGIDSLFKTWWSRHVHRQELGAHLLLVIHLSWVCSGEPNTSWVMTPDAAAVCHPLWSQITFAHLKTRWSRTRSFKQLRYRYCSVCLCAEPEKSLYVLLLHNLTTHWMVYSWGLFWPRELGVLNQRRSSRLCRGLGGETKQADEQRWIEIPPQWESDQGNRHQSPARLFSLTTWSPDALFECSISASLHVHMHAFTQKRRHCRR